MKSAPVVVINAGNASANITNGVVVPAGQVLYVSAQVVTTGTSTGTLKLQFSNDNSGVNPNSPVPTHWVDITNATVTVAAAGTVGIQKTEICANYIRAIWTKDNGAAGTLTATLMVTGI